jgi:hypothetical protein
MNFPPNLAWCSIQEENSQLPNFVPTTFIVYTVPSPNCSISKGGKPSSVGKYFSTSGKMIVNVAHQSFAASHLHNTLGKASPITLARETASRKR